MVINIRHATSLYSFKRFSLFSLSPLVALVWGAQEELHPYYILSFNTWELFLANECSQRKFDLINLSFGKICKIENFIVDKFLSADIHQNKISLVDLFNPLKKSTKSKYLIKVRTHISLLVTKRYVVITTRIYLGR